MAQYLSYIFLCLIFFSCGATNKAVEGGAHLQSDLQIIEKNDSLSNEENVQFEKSSKTEVALPVISKDKTKLIDKSIIKNIEIGSLSSLKNAVSKLLRPELNYTEQEIILLHTATKMLHILFPQEKINWELPELGKSTSNYIASINSAQKGVYDYSSVQVDCLSCALPSLILITVPSVTNYYYEAEQALKAAIEFNNETFFAKFLLGLLLNRQNRFLESVPFLKDAYNAEKSISVIIAYIEALLATNQSFLALELSKENLILHNYNTQLLRFASEAAFLEKNYDDADSFIAQALQKDPENADYLMFRIRVLMARGEYIKASSLLDMYAKVDKSNKMYLLLKAQLLVEWNKNSVAASSFLEEALIKYKDDTDVLLAASSLATMTNQKIAGLSALEMTEKVLQVEPDNFNAKRILVAENIKQKNWQKAYDINLQILQKFSTNQDSLFSQIEICIGLNKISEAQNALDSLKKINVVSPEALDEAVLKILIAQNKKDEAEKLILKLLPSANGKNKSNLYYEKSRISSDEEQKLSDLRSSLTANPRNQNALFDLYQIYFEKKDYRKAQYYLKQVVALNPNDSSLLQLNQKLDDLLKR
ncbi:MAG: tetratricopeptide repeat protein [Treponema sp.]|nr:tetratricopeptide repeat protein [Treponema sp.]